VGIGHGADGGFAEYVKVSETSVVKLPPDVDPVGACLYGCPMGVALHALRDAAGLHAGETAVVTGAGGGLGVHAVQLARALGARVLAVTTSEEKEARLRELGAHEVIYAPGLDFGEVVLGLTDDQGADVVMNNLGPTAFEGCWRALGQFGRMALVGDVTGGGVTIQPAELLFRDARLIGVSGVSRSQLRDVARMVAAGLVRPVVSQTFTLDEALEAYRLMRERRSFGRLALAPG
jgi:NADPH:quinone reductase-like Zn-dependent oxidoreductase